MRLQGSCHCGAVRFALESDEAVPFQHCYCSICRKLGGGGGYLINLGGRAETLVVEGQEQVKVYRARIPDGAGHRISAHERHFCSQCGAHLWAFHPDWPELIHPVAGAIDSELPAPPQHRHMMVGSKASWVPLWAGPDDGFATGYPDSSLADWHSAHDAASLAPTVHPPPATGNEAIHIYHIAQGADWHAAQALGEYRTASLESDGFIHCSTRPQVLPTAHRYFLGQRNLRLMQIDPQVLGTALRYEPVGTDALHRVPDYFPHLYDALPLEAIVAVHPFECTAQGTFSWPV